jgi:hypothetical protein
MGVCVSMRTCENARGPYLFLALVLHHATTDQGPQVRGAHALQCAALPGPAHKAPRTPRKQWAHKRGTPTQAFIHTKRHKHTGWDPDAALFPHEEAHPRGHTQLLPHSAVRAAARGQAACLDSVGSALVSGATGSTCRHGGAAAVGAAAHTQGREHGACRAHTHAATQSDVGRRCPVWDLGCESTWH